VQIIALTAGTDDGVLDDTVDFVGGRLSACAPHGRALAVKAAPAADEELGDDIETLFTAAQIARRKSVRVIIGFTMIEGCPTRWLYVRQLCVHIL
jgi:hypothetical protein